VIQVDFKAYKTDRTTIMNRLKERNIGTQVHYIPVYKHPYFKKMCGEISEYFPETEQYYAEALSLPLYYDLKEEDVRRVVSDLKKVLMND